MAAEKYFGGRLWSFGNSWEFIVLDLRLGDSRGAPKPSGRAPEACGLLGDLLALSISYVGVLWSKKNHHEIFILFGLRLLFLSKKAKKQGKNSNCH